MNTETMRKCLKNEAILNTNTGKKNNGKTCGSCFWYDVKLKRCVCGGLKLKKGLEADTPACNEWDD